MSATEIRLDSARAAGRARALLAEGVRALVGAGFASPRLDAEWLLAQILGVDRLTLYTDSPVVADGEARRYADTLGRRAAGEPLQYILGWEEFRGRRLRVNPAVLVPRPETELLVEWALDLLPAGGRVADVGTGSGAIACAVAAARPDVRVIAIDVSVLALAVAADNVARLGLDGRVALVAGDLSTPLRGGPEALDLVVANPPYIPSPLLRALPREVRGWEPHLALDGGPDGMGVARRLIADAPRVLRRGGALVMEIGEDQAAPLATAMRAAGFHDVATRRDLSGVERYIAGIRGPGDWTGARGVLGSRWGGLGEERRSPPPRVN